LEPGRDFQPPKVSASQGESLYGLPAEDEIPLDAGQSWTDTEEDENRIRVDAANPPSAQVLIDPLSRTPCDCGPCTRHCWPELYGDTDIENDPYFVISDEINPVNELIADLDLILDGFSGRSPIAPTADLVRRI